LPTQKQQQRRRRRRRRRKSVTVWATAALHRRTTPDQ